MEEIIEKIIQIDNSAKEIVKSAEYKKNNLEIFIDKEIDMKKCVLDAKMKNELEAKQKEYKQKYEKEKNRIEDETKKEIEKLQKEFFEGKEEIEEQIIKDVLKKVE